MRVITLEESGERREETEEVHRDGSRKRMTIGRLRYDDDGLPLKLCNTL
jgi:hypothetical protein